MQDSSQDRDATRWSPSLVEWAFQALSGSLEGKDRARLDALRLEWERARLAALAEAPPGERVQALALLSRHEWHPALAGEAQAAARKILDDLTAEQLQEVGRLLLESAQLRLAEQEDLSPPERVKALNQEAAQVRLVRERLAAVLERAGKSSQGAKEKRRLLGRLASMERKLLDQADEARILERLERTLGERAWTWFSRVTFFGLLVLLVLLFADLFLTLSPSNQAARDWTDTGICFLLLLEFGLRLWAAPRKGRWFLRHFLTDFVPALPFALLLPSPPPAEVARARVEDGMEFLVRSVRLFRIPVYARYVRFLKPVVGVMRILLFWVRGMDRIVLSMAHVLNRQVVFFENVPTEEKGAPGEESLQERISHHFERLSPKMRKKAAPGLLAELAEQVEEILHSGNALPVLTSERGPSWRGGTRVLRAEELVRTLETLTPELVAKRLPESTIRGLARLLALMDIPFLRRLPLLGPLAAAPPGAHPAQRVARAGRALGSLGRRIVALLTNWADLGGVVTAPQILNRIATAMIRSTQRPAVRLLLFGFLFLLAKLFFEAILSMDLDRTGVGRFLDRFVGTPLLVLGGVCLVILVLGRWLKRLAGEASERLLRASEARFANLLELLRRRKEREDLDELVRRVCPDGAGRERLEREIRAGLDELRSGGGLPGEEPVPPRARKLALLLLDFQDGALLHKTDTKTVEQFLSHPDLWSLRHDHLGLGKREEKRLSRLDLESGKVLSGPFLWFDLATQALALKVARLCGSYNLHLLPLDRLEKADPERKERHRALLEGREGLRTEPGGDIRFQTSFFHVLHFLSPDPVLTREVESVYGKEVLKRLRADRRRLIREVFGVRPLGRLPLEKRSFNPLTFYFRHLGGGRFFLVPLEILWAAGKGLWATARLAVRSAREILDPRLRRSDKVDTSAPFPVAQRKLRRMKKPLLLEAILLCARTDPFYMGLSPSGEDQEGISPWSGDLELAAPTPPEQVQLEGVRKNASQRLLYFPAFLEALGGGPAEGTVEFRRLLSAFAADEKGLARLAAAGERARAWLEWARNPEETPPPGTLPPPPDGPPWRASRKGLGILLSMEPGLPGRARSRLKRAWRKNEGDIRTLCYALAEAGPESTGRAARALAERLLEETPAWRERWETLQAVLALIVRDLRHHEEILYLLGEYGETPL